MSGPGDHLEERRNGRRDEPHLRHHKCMEFGREYNGTIVPGGLGDSQHTDTALECQGLCWRMKGCQAFTWLRGNNNPCYLYHSVAVGATRVNSRAVSGLASCEEKGLTLEPRLTGVCLA